MIVLLHACIINTEFDCNDRLLYNGLVIKNPFMIKMFAKLRYYSRTKHQHVKPISDNVVLVRIDTMGS